MLVGGVDGCPGGWVAVSLRGGRFAGAHFGRTFRELLTQLEQAGAVGVDIPIGWEGPRRRADELARQVLGPRRSSVFAAPPPEVLQSETYAAANQLHRELTGGGLSYQSYSLVRRIKEVAETEDPRVFEVHPEVCFWKMAGETPLRRSKVSWNGHRQRLSLLAEQGIVLPEELAGAGHVPPADLVDAAAAAWSAHRHACGQALSMPFDGEVRILY